MKFKKNLFRVILVAAVLVLFAGCAVVPKPFTSQEVDERADEDIREMFKNQEPIDKPVTLYEAMARAIKYNLDHRLKLMEEALATNQLDVSKFDLLPRLSGKAGYSKRNNEQGSSSIALTGPNAGTESLVMSTSRERRSRSASIDVVWNVLDFGVSYIRAKQQADQILIIEERRRKVIQNILQEVRYAYWRAASAEYLIDDMLKLLNRSREALERSRQIEGQRLKTPRGALEYQKALLENIRLLWSLIQKLKPAKSELASLININPGTSFKIAQPEWGNGNDLPMFNIPVEELERIAMVNRPEILENDYKHRISTLEIKKSFLNMLPGLELEAGYSHDSNKYLYNNDWLEAGTNVAWNIFDGLLTGPANIKAAKSKVEVDVMGRRALSMAILAQVHLAYQRYHLIKEEYSVSKQLNEINEQLQSHSSREKEAGSVHEMTLIHDATNALLARMRDHMGYADLQNAAGKIYTTLGVDIMPGEVDSLDIGALSAEIKNAFIKQKSNFERITEEYGKNESPDAMTARAALLTPEEMDEEADTEVEQEVVSAEVEAEYADEAEVMETESEAAAEDIEIASTVEAEVEETVVEADVEEQAAEAEEVQDYEPQPEYKTALVTGSNVNVRKGPSAKESVVSRIAKKGTVVALTGEEENGWVKVNYGDREGWIVSRYVEAAGEIEAEETVNTEEVKAIEPDPEVQAVTDLPESETGYKKAVITGENINMRKGPSKRYGVLCRIAKKGTIVSLLGEKDRNWVKIKFADSDGWIYSRYLEEI